MTSKKETRPRALVTGASSGLGVAFAERLAKDGYDLIVVARRGDKLEALAKRLNEEHGAEVEALTADLSKHDDLLKVEKRIAMDNQLKMLVNNAGGGMYMPFIQLEPDQAEELINLQALAVARLTRAALPGMIERKKGVVINVSSRLAFSRSMNSPRMPQRATYAAAKAFVNTFTQILSSELEGTGVQVQALCPGVMRTEFHLRMGRDPSRFPPEVVMPVEDVVEASLAGLKSGEVICVPALDDAGVLDRIWEAERKLLELSGGGKAAQRYQT